jgi:anti-anti-sigma factor
MAGALKWDVESIDGIPVVRIEGRMDNAGSPLLDQLLQRLLQEGKLRIVLNMDEVEYLSSAGMRTILSAAKKAHADGGLLVLSNLQEQVQDLIHMAGFDTILTIVGAEGEAVAKARG